MGFALSLFWDSVPVDLWLSECWVSLSSGEMSAFCAAVGSWMSRSTGADSSPASGLGLSVCRAITLRWMFLSTLARWSTLWLGNLASKGRLSSASLSVSSAEDSRAVSWLPFFSLGIQKGNLLINDLQIYWKGQDECEWHTFPSLLIYVSDEDSPEDRRK